MPGMPAAARESVQPLLDRGERLLERIRGVRCDLAGLAKTRFHGDLHLGQVLASQDDFIIVDFEGEPGRSLEERRAKSCVLRDVAGMLRSFSYAAYAAAVRPEAGSTLTPEAQQSLSSWEDGARRHFLEGYFKATAEVASVPSERASFDALLDLFLLEKALYELRYEIANRPDWVGIPLRGLLELADTQK